MSESAVAQDKKAPDPKKDESWDEKVSVRCFESGMLSTQSLPNVGAFRFEKDGSLKFYTKAKAGAMPAKGAEITDKDGRVYVVEKVVSYNGPGYHLSTVKPKPKP